MARKNPRLTYLVSSHLASLMKKVFFIKKLLIFEGLKGDLIFFVGKSCICFSFSWGLLSFFQFSVGHIVSITINQLLIFLTLELTAIVLKLFCL